MALEQLVVDIDRLQIQTRIRALGDFSSNHLDRQNRLADELGSLDSGWYLVGLGPNFPHTVSVRHDPLVLGQGDTLDDGLCDPSITHQVNEFGPVDLREVSKVHMFVRCNELNGEFQVKDAGSISGTWLENQSQRLTVDEWFPVPSGGLIRLGTSGTNIFMSLFVD